jgi:hypothetical protein
MGKENRDRLRPDGVVRSIVSVSLALGLKRAAGELDGNYNVRIVARPGEEFFPGDGRIRSRIKDGKVGVELTGSGGEHRDKGPLWRRARELTAPQDPGKGSRARRRNTEGR